MKVLILVLIGALGKNLKEVEDEVESMQEEEVYGRSPVAEEGMVEEDSDEEVVMLRKILKELDKYETTREIYHSSEPLTQALLGTFTTSTHIRTLQSELFDTELQDEEDNDFWLESQNSIPLEQAVSYYGPGPFGDELAETGLQNYWLDFIVLAGVVFSMLTIYGLFCSKKLRNRSATRVGYSRVAMQAI